MSTFLYAMLAIVPIVVLFLSFYSLFRKRAQGVPMKKAMVSHIATLLVLVVLMSALALGASAANEADQPGVSPRRPSRQPPMRTIPRRIIPRV